MMQLLQLVCCPGMGKIDNMGEVCHKKGHMKADCWAPGGSFEGKGPVMDL